MSIESIRISSFMTRNVKTETEDQNIQAVCKTMNENNIGSLIIMTPPYDNNPKPVGIITERDVVRIIGQSIELQTPEADLPLQDEEKSDEILKNVEQEIECPRCSDIMTLSSEFDKLGYSCQECDLLLVMK